MKTKTAALNGKPDAGNPHVRFDEGEVASAKPRRGSLLYRRFAVAVALVVLSTCAMAAGKAARPAFVTDFRVANPFVVADWTKRIHCLYEAEGEKVLVRTSPDLKAWSAPRVALELPASFAAEGVRAPKVFVRNHVHYLFATVGRGVRVFSSKSPCGPFVPHSAGSLTPAGWNAKDGVLFVDDDTPYLVFCREGEKGKPGEMCFLRLSDDLAKAVGVPKTMFTTDALKVFKACVGSNEMSSPFLRRVVGGDLYLVWTAKLAVGSVILQCRSKSRHPEGPWVEQKPILLRQSAGAMLFNAIGDQPYLAVHRTDAPDAGPRMELYSLLESTSGFELQSAEPPVKMGPEYRVADFPGHGVVPGSALDLSALVGEGPAGQYGFVRTAKDGSFEFENRPGVRVRFNGFNGGAPWRLGGVDFRLRISEYLRRLKAQGYNCLRLSLPGMDSIDEKTGAFSFDAKALDNWDWSIAEMKRNGIYVIFNVGTGRFGRKNHLYAWENRDDLKCRMYLGDEEVRRHWRNLANLALNHVNPYTGKAMKDDGMFIAVECYNEQALGLDRAPRPVPGDRYDYTLALVKWYNKTLRELGWRGLITQFNYSKRLIESKVRYLEEDMAISNCYFCHPIGGWGTVGTKMLQHSSYLDGLGYWRCNPGMRLPGRPFFITEHNHCFWNPSQYEEVAFSAYSAFQNFGGVCIHEGAVKANDFPHAASPFCVADNPVNLADEFLHAMLFLRGDVAASPHTVTLAFGEKAFAQYRNGAPNARQTMLSLVSGFGVDYPETASRYPRPKADFSIPAAGASGVFIEAWFTNVLDGPQGAFDPDKAVAALRRCGVLSADNRTDPKRGIWESDTKELILDQSNLTFTVRTPRTEAFAGVKGRSAELPHVGVKSLPTGATVALTSLDGRPLDDAERMMLVVNTRALNLGTEFVDGGRRMSKAGSAPVTLATGVFDLSFRGRVPTAVFPLSVDGRRRAPLAVEPTEGGWRLRLDTAALPNGPTPFFEVVAAKPPASPRRRIALVGDSITEIAVRMKPDGFYHRLTNACARAGRDISFVPLGYSGYQVGTWLGMERRAASGKPPVKTRDGCPYPSLQQVFDAGADTLVVFLGMNDILKPTVSDADASLDAWAADLKTLAEELKAKFSAKEVVLATVTPLTADPESPKNTVRDRMNLRVRALASAAGWRVADYGRVIADLQDETRRISANYRLVPDFVHPNALGHAALAAELCRTLGEKGLADGFEAEVRAGVAALAATAKSKFSCRLRPVNRQTTPDAESLVCDLEWTWNGEGLAEIEAFAPDWTWGVRPRKAKGRTGVLRLVVPLKRLSDDLKLAVTAGGKREDHVVSVLMPWRVWREEPGVTNAALVVGTADYTGGASPHSIDPYQYEFGGRTNVIRAARWVSSEKRRNVRLKLSHATFSATLDVRAYLNGKLVMDDRMNRNGRNQVVTNAVLEAGVNCLELRVENRDWQRQFACEILPADPKDELRDLTYSWSAPALSPAAERFCKPLDAAWERVDAVPSSACGIHGAETDARTTYTPDSMGYMGLGARVRILRKMDGSALHFGHREGEMWKVWPYCVTDWDGDGHTDLIAAPMGAVRFYRLSDIRGKQGEERYFFGSMGIVSSRPQPKGKVLALAADDTALYLTTDVGVWRLRKDVPPYDRVLPALRRVEGVRASESVDVASFGQAAFCRGTVEGAPESVADQAYRIVLSREGVRVVAGGEAGERYARATLDQLAKLAEGGCVPAATVSDWPELKWRGFMNDCGRNFLGMDGVKAMIDVMAAAKMNLFHWHLTEYHGWRLESKLFPKLTAPETMMRQVGRFYTQDDFREIVAYAKARGITVMPEFDVPGHSLALRKGLGIDEMRAPGTDAKVAALLEELCSLAPKEVMPFVHIGTDEVRVDPERVPEGWCSKWADVVAACGRTTVVWAPGEKISGKGPIVDMAWHDDQVTNSANAYFDAARMYFASTGPELVLNQAAYVRACRWAVDPKRTLGAIACAWHDDNVGDDDTRLFADSTIVPGILAFADSYWAGGRTDRPQYLARLPPADTSAFSEAARLERRLVAARDRMLAGFPYAVPYLAQANRRWRVSLEDGTLLDGDLPGALVDIASLTTNLTGVAIAETWVKSPKAQDVGAWIGVTKTGSAYTRNGIFPLPKLGQWNKQGATVEINGVRIDPPKWDHPGLVPDGHRDADGKSYHGAVYSSSLCETPLGNQWHYTREPTRVSLKEGWNHVKFTLPMPKKCPRGQWRCAFHLLEGSSAHPREVAGLEYASRPPTCTK